MDRDDDKADLGDSNYDEFSGYAGSLFSNMDVLDESKAHRDQNLEPKH